MCRASRGDDTAFEALVDRCQAGLIQFFVMLSHNPSLGEDLAQEVFIRLYKNRHGYRPEARFKTYLYRIARNLWTDHLRRQPKQGRDLSLDAVNDRGASLGHMLAAESPDPLPVDRKTLYLAVLRLSRQQREVLLLSLLEDLSYPEIAAVLSIPVGTVKSRVYHAVRKLRTILS